MSPGAHLLTLVSNEARALLPAWIVCALAAIAATTLTAGGTHEVSLFALGAATIGLGAQSIGHEYAHGTLGLLLTLPVARRRLFLVKQAVLGAMVLPLAIYAWLMGLVPAVPALPWLTAAAALCLAPALTMLCRSQLAGAILSMSVPGMLITAVMILVNGTLLNASAQAEREVLATWSRLMLPLLATGAVMGWWLFMRLESSDGGASEIQLTWRTRTSRDFARRHPLWQLVKKELRLQQLTFVMTALYLVTSWPNAVLLRNGMSDDAFFIAAAIYWLAVPALVGSLASAGERQLGTLSWQLQLPTPAWQQWGTKVGIVFGLALLLAIGVPAPIAHVLWPTKHVVTGLGVALVILLTAGSLYISSLCRTGLRAAVASFAVIPLVLWVLVRFILALLGTQATPDFWSGREGAWLALLSLVVALLVRFAFVNHRPEQPAPARIWRQTLFLVALVGFGLVVLETAIGTSAPHS